ncbi:hypothetical protein ACFWXO_05410 [Kitasatospora sp. NPDC059088]|uniref:hypothetical protein n=1 Tax=Kitasatospora sp. NPDC059088 TaxID=3346722 RepID=UPI0036BE6EE6
MAIAALYVLHELAADLAADSEKRDLQGTDRDSAASVRAAQHQARETRHTDIQSRTHLTLVVQEILRRDADDAVALADLAAALSEATRLRVRMLLAFPADADAPGPEHADAARQIADGTRAVLTTLVNAVVGYAFVGGAALGPTLRTAQAALAPMVDLRAALDITPAGLAPWAADVAKAVTAFVDPPVRLREAIPVDQVRDYLQVAGTEELVTRGSLGEALDLPGPHIAAALDALVNAGQVDYDPTVGWVYSSAADRP